MSAAEATPSMSEKTASFTMSETIRLAVASTWPSSRKAAAGPTPILDSTATGDLSTPE